MGLAGAITSLVQDSAARAKLNLNLSLDCKLPALSPDVEQCIYRVTQEAVMNVINHAQAKNLSVKLDYQDDRIELDIQDDGIGFDMEKNHKPGHFGIKGMVERAQMAGGEIRITSRPGQGTRVQLII
jgi:signal transduction histidine kinase